MNNTSAHKPNYLESFLFSSSLRSIKICLYIFHLNSDEKGYKQSRQNLSSIKCKVYSEVEE